MERLTEQRIGELLHFPTTKRVRFLLKQEVRTLTTAPSLKGRQWLGQP